MRRLITIAFPEVDAETGTFLARFRRENCTAAQHAIPLHFTLVFGCSAVPDPEYLAHAAAVAAQADEIAFVCRYAMLGADDEDDRAYVFLVPEEGFAAIARLHDRLYTGPMAPHLRLDLPYVPHITIGAMTERSRAKRLCDELNDRRVSVTGRLRAVTVGVRTGETFTPLSEFQLRTR